MTKPITFDDSFDGALCCPFCGFAYLHHRKISIFERREDADKGLHVVVDGESVKVDTDIKRNPSERRNGLSIQFECEGCSEKPVLTLVQHKGNTYLYF